MLYLIPRSFFRLGRYYRVVLRSFIWLGGYYLVIFLSFIRLDGYYLVIFWSFIRLEDIILLSFQVLTGWMDIIRAGGDCLVKSSTGPPARHQRFTLPPTLPPMHCLRWSSSKRHNTLNWLTRSSSGRYFPLILSDKSFALIPLRRRH